MNELKFEFAGIIEIRSGDRVLRETVLLVQYSPFQEWGYTLWRGRGPGGAKVIGGECSRDWSREDAYKAGHAAMLKAAGVEK